MKYSFEKIEDRKSYVWHTEGNNKTLIAITDDVEKAHFLATAANSYKEPSSLPEEGEGVALPNAAQVLSGFMWKEKFPMDAIEFYSTKPPEINQAKLGRLLQTGLVSLDTATAPPFCLPCGGERR